ncbi:hypothetical protein L7F22_017917 [Adiantum nelumboides]|nr:hypothetical protein [Adiantum nelumboides]
MEISACFKNEYLTDKDFGDAFRALKSLNPTPAEMNMFASYTVMDELLYYLDRICVSHNGALRKMLIQEHHEGTFAAYPGINKTYCLLSAIYFWPQMQQNVIKYVKACHSCQIMKASRQLPQGLLQPLPVPKERWESISMDFITTLPRTTKGNAKILVIVDRFSKMAHFIPCKKAAFAPDIASLFVQHIFSIHGLPRPIIFDRDPKFIGHFWTSLFKSLGTNLFFSSAYHLQTDGQIERVNQILEEMLRHYIKICLASWEEYLPLVEFAYNNAPHSVTGMIPFQAAYGHTPLVPTNFVLQHKVALAYQLVQEMQDILAQVRDRLIHAQQRLEHKERLRQLLSSELTKSGTWHFLKEEMKQRIVKVAYEKFRLLDGQQKDSFIFYNSLYVQLLEAMRDSIKDLDLKRREGFLNYSQSLDTEASKRVHPKEKLKQLADYYEADGEYFSANKCYEESLSEEATNPDLWLQYGLFLMRETQKDHGKAEECFREAIRLCADHAKSLLALASLMWHRSFYQESEVLLNVIIDRHFQEEAIAWVLLGQVLLSSENRSKDASSCFTRAESLHVALKDTKSLASYELKSCLLKHPFGLSHSVLQNHIPDNPYVCAAMLLLDLHLPKEAQAVLSNVHAASSCSVEYQLCLGRALELLDYFDEAERSMREAIGSNDAQGALWTHLAHLYYKSSLYQRAIEAYEKMLQYGKEQPFFEHGCLELGKCYLQTRQIENAKRVFLDVCSSQPSSSSWLGAGIAFYEEDNMTSAEAAFVEGNVLDPWNFKLWAYLALVCLRTHRMEAAEFSFNQALQLHPSQPLLMKLAECFYENGNISAAKRAVLKACQRTPDAVDLESLSECEYWQEKLGLITRNTVEMQNNATSDVTILNTQHLKCAGCDTVTL